MSFADPQPAVPAPDHTPRRGGPSHRHTPPHDPDAPSPTAAPASASATSDVVVTHWQRTGTDTYAVSAQWPTANTFHTPIADTWHDPLLAAESLRTASLLVGQNYYGIPRGHRWVVDELDIEVVPAALLTSPGPADIRLELARTPDPEPDTDTDLGTSAGGGADAVTASGVEGGAGTAMTMEAELLRDNDTFVGAGRISLHYLPPTAHAQPRTTRPGSPRRPPTGLPPLPEALPPPVVGRLNSRDVVLASPTTRTGPATHTWQLRIDPAHPALRGHLVDHVPPMLLLEAARQAAQAVNTPYRVLPIDIRATYHHPVKLHTPCTITATSLPRHDATDHTTFHITATQDNNPHFTTVITTAPTD
ncbi:ScbA/BarX family gamma-butyrolactone biosynthesis protein [Streptomyces sp. NPDC127038]|uniref:ScbA/BarX family gamma-butyrolactone biosynthesis protein n=1 Tax=Streptomyces sp. NPDC127038 TaxID=3347114 RepID=UPI0036504F7A